jgi:F-type H+-transporting ATPase subunit b
MFRLIAQLFVVALVCVAIQFPAAAYAAGDEHVEAHVEGGHGEGGHDAGLPMNWSEDLALFSLITFAVYLAVLRVGAWGPLQAGLNERERGIRQNIADAESSRLKSAALLKDHELKLAEVQEEVRDILAEARRDAEHTKQEIVAVAQKEADATKHRAIAEIERSRDQALTELFDFVSTNVVNATEQVIGRSLSGADHDRLVKDALAQLNVRRN